MSDERIQALEEKIAYVEKSVSDLDAVVRSLSDKLDVVLAQMKRISVQAAEDGDLNAPADEKPPHY